jgi:hypothetical protein
MNGKTDAQKKGGESIPALRLSTLSAASGFSFILCACAQLQCPRQNFMMRVKLREDKLVKIRQY